MGHKPFVFTFADVEVREREFCIVKSGETLAVEPKAFRVLVFLLRNPHRLITKDELLDAVWNDCAVSDNSLTRSIALLRRLLGDDTHEPRYIATVPTVGYRFLCEVKVAENGFGEEDAADLPHLDHGNRSKPLEQTPIIQSRLHGPQGQAATADERAGGMAAFPASANSEIAPSKVPISWPLWFAPATALMVVVVIVALFVWQSLLGRPTIESALQLTDDGNPKLLTSALLSDGYRIFFNELRAGSPVIAQVAASGGETGQIISRIQSPRLAALAKDSSSLLVLEESNFFGSLWSLPLPAGEPRRLRNVVAQNANFTPDGHLIFGKDTSLFIAERDGSDPRKLSDLPSYVDSPVISPDGKRIRLTVQGSYTKSLWEVNSDGSNAHPLLAGWEEEGTACCGHWTADGRYFVFQSRRQGRTDLWAIREGNGWSARSSSPLRLTNGPLSYELPFPSPDGEHIFAIGLKPRGELVRFDSTSQQFVPYLSGISALDATVSHDGKWVTYMTYPDRSLWRSRTDGSERLQLTYAPTVVAWPRISPDGTKVAFSSSDVNCSSCVYVLPLEGGTPIKVAENARTSGWSPDSTSLVTIFTGQGSANKVCSVTSFEGLEMIDLRTGKITLIPDSREMGGPFWPSSNTLVAPSLKPGKEGFATFDLKTQKWSLLVKGVFQHWMTSIDGEYLYLMTVGNDPKIVRVRLSNGSFDTMASLRSFRPVVDEDTDKWLGVAADGSPLLTRDIGTQEIYDLNIKWN
ncbi:winged helix-turn-helix domain-containing protein [Edaphobacter sp. HDX4]|uniref:winged helix-turn-helix domain-containing protein n=1 Tax=Edaphobacter sp. HDX4 TaxID=2794064 RepID=UPI002FE6597E